MKSLVQGHRAKGCGDRVRIRTLGSLYPDPSSLPKCVLELTFSNCGVRSLVGYKVPCIDLSPAFETQRNEKKAECGGVLNPETF